MLTNDKIPRSPGPLWEKRGGQAMAEMMIGLVTFAVLFLGVLLVMDLCRARMVTILQARKEAGGAAAAGLLSGAPSLYGSADMAERLKSDVLAAVEDPITYSQYADPDHPYIEENMAAPLYNPSGTLIGTFQFVMAGVTLDVTNSPFLRGLGVGAATIPVQEQACLPLMKDFE